MDTKPNRSSRVLERLKATIPVVYNDFMELWKSCNEQERQQFLEELDRLLKEL